MRSLGDALSLAAWLAVFRDGLVLDPRPVVRALDDDSLEWLSCLSPNCGVVWLACAEMLFRAGLLVADWNFECIGVRAARLTYQPVDRAELTQQTIFMGAA